MSGLTQRTSDGQPLKVGFLWHCPYPWDVRLEKIMRACVERGYEVCLICKGKRGLSAHERIGDFDVHRIFARSGWGVRLQKLLSYPLFLNPLWIFKTGKLLMRQKVGLLVVRDLPLALLAGKLGKWLGIPVMLDMAENYPAALMVYTSVLYKPFRLRNGWILKKFEKYALKKVDHVLVVTEEQRQRLLVLGLDPARITIVGNTPEAWFYQAADDQPAGGEAGRLDMLFVGFLDAHRGTKVAVSALPKLLTEFPGLRLTLVGDGKQRAELMQLARCLGLEKHVEFPGWVDFRQVPGYVGRSTLCLIPHLRSEHTDTTLPNKLFDYMSYAKPVVASDCAPIRRIIEETGCGATFASGNEEDFVRVVGSLLRNPERNKMGLRGKQAIAEKYNWEADKARFFQAMEQTVRGTR